MATVAVIGAGLGGLPAAYELRHYLGSEHEVVLISEHEHFTFIPGLIPVGLGHVPLQRIQLDLATLCRRHKLRWVHGKVAEIDPVDRRLTFSPKFTTTHPTPDPLQYDYLVIASGAELANDLIPGLGIHTHSVCNPHHALAAHQAWQKFLANPSDLVVGAAPGAGCFGPAYEFALLADHDLRQRGLRDRVKITYVTPEPYVGHLGIPDVQDAQHLSEALMQRQEIHTVTNAEISMIQADRLHLADGRSFPFGYSMVLPAFRGAGFVRAAGLGNAKGFLPILPTQRHRDHDRIYGVGVSVDLPQPAPTPIPIKIPKSGQMTEAMALVAAHNIAVELGALKAPLETPTLEALCFAEFGQTGIAYIAAPILPDPSTGQRRYSYAVEGVWVNWAKQAFEYYFMQKMRWGVGLPWYEKMGLRWLFGLNLSRPLPTSSQETVTI
ncbi:MAG: NAD(P)/FAD-dependent oxidoreductase [Prochlorothrix sp.]